MTDTIDLREQVRTRYAAAASAVRGSAGQASCCPTPAETDDRFGGALYTQLDRDDLPVAAVAASLGCGNPTAVADPGPGNACLTSAPGAASTCCCRPSGSGRAATRTGST